MYAPFPFDIGDVAHLCGIPAKGRNERGHEYCDCPFCGKKAKLNLNYQKNQFRCNYCNAGGSMLQLYSQLNGFSGTNAEIVSEIKKELDIPENSNYRMVKSTQAAHDDKKSFSVDFESMKKIDSVYRMFLSQLKLASFHRGVLKNERFLNDVYINKCMFRSVPIFGAKRAVGSIVTEGLELDGVPGFYKDGNTWAVNLTSNMTGIIIPVFNYFGFIECIQIRLDRPFGKTRYLYLSSSGLPCGTSCRSVPYFIKGSVKTQTLVVTEGAFKAIIPNRIFGYSIMALAGVNNQKEFERVIPYIKENGIKTIVEAFDADYRTNVQVAKAKEQFKNLCESNGFNFETITWEPEKGKGFDDFAISYYNEH